MVGIVKQASFVFPEHVVHRVADPVIVARILDVVVDLPRLSSVNDIANFIGGVFVKQRNVITKRRGHHWHWFDIG